MAELTTIAMTYNLWGRNYLVQREPALRAFLELRWPASTSTRVAPSDHKAVIAAYTLVSGR